jgi:adenylate kinase family enzyme
MSCHPPVVLIDCSEMELGRSLGQRQRGRLDSNLEAYKRRLQLYRENTMPMLKTLDEESRLHIV